MPQSISTKAQKCFELSLNFFCAQHEKTQSMVAQFPNASKDTIAGLYLNDLNSLEDAILITNKGLYHKTLDNQIIEILFENIESQNMDSKEILKTQKTHFVNLTLKDKNSYFLPVKGVWRSHDMPPDCGVSDIANFVQFIMAARNIRRIELENHIRSRKD